MKRVQQGFTLIELMIVVAIIAILAAIALPAYQNYVAKSQATAGLADIRGGVTAFEEGIQSGERGSAAATNADIGLDVSAPRCSAITVAGAIMGNCGCHGGGSGGLMFNDAASFKAATVNVKATKADMNRITPGKIDESYILYKLHGQQAKVPGGGGSQMPLGGQQLSDDKLCLMINWVKSIK